MGEDMGGDVNRTDGELMALAGGGDRAAFEEIVGRHRAAAESFAVSLVRDRALAEDIVQECFVRLWLHRETYRPDFKFRTYFFTLVKHCAADELRKRRGELSLDEMTETDGGTIAALANDSPEAIVVDRELFGGICELMERLRSESGDCLYLFAVCGVRTRDIAHKLGISEVNVRVRIHRERARLKKMLEREGLL